MKRKNTHFRNGTFYTIRNSQNKLALAMPPTQKYSKDRPHLQPYDTNNINQIWMIQEVQPGRFQIVHAISTYVLTVISNTNGCKIDFGKQKNNQLFYFQWVYESREPVEHKIIEGKQLEFSERRITEENMPRKTNWSKIVEPSLGKKKLTFRIKDKQNSHKYLFCGKDKKKIEIQDQFLPPEKQSTSIKFMEIDLQSHKDSAIWEIEKIDEKDNAYLAKTCTIASFRSGYALDVPEASNKQGIQIIQYPCHFRFNQRWILKKIDPATILVYTPGHHLPKRAVTQQQSEKYGYYKIMNAKTKLFLDIKGQLTKQGTPIIQWAETNGRNQIWRLQEQGKRTYIIRSALENDIVLSVKDDSLKEAAEIVTSKIQKQHFWVIIGHIPKS